MALDSQWLLNDYGSTGDAGRFLEIAQENQRSGNLHLAATAMDRAFAIDPFNLDIREAREALLKRLSVAEHGIRFRYIPGGAFVMGSQRGDADEQPAHPLRLDHFWMSETAVSWNAFCRIMDWDPPPRGQPSPIPERDGKFDEAFFRIVHGNRLRLQYCEDETLAAGDWHIHVPDQVWVAQGNKPPARGERPPRANPDAPYLYDNKPMVGASWEDAQQACAALSAKAVAGSEIRYSLPNEAQWEKSARGGLVGRAYAWGDESPNDKNCDFNHFDRFSILPMKRFAPNDYGLYAVCGSVWEWTSNWYDAQAYSESAAGMPSGPVNGKQRVARGGSWADCAEAVTVSFRMSADPNERAGMNPNIGFRICRSETQV